MVDLPLRGDLASLYTTMIGQRLRCTVEVYEEPQMRGFALHLSHMSPGALFRVLDILSKIEDEEPSITFTGQSAEPEAPADRFANLDLG